MDKDYDLRDLQLKLLEILIEVDKICKEQNITYYLIAGTLLGAVRHQGFIPWDDDMDIAMPRRDYEKFLQVANKFFPDYFEVKDYRSDPDYFLCLSKVEDNRTMLSYGKHLKYKGGIGIDLFPLDGVPVNKFRRRFHFLQISFYKRIRYFLYRDPFKHGRGVGSWPFRIIQKMYDRQQIQRKLELVRSECDYDSSELICDHDVQDVSVMPKTYIGKPVPVLFEGRVFYGVENADAYLTSLYGDYMQLPPEDQRKQHHYPCLDLNKSFKD